MDGLSTLAIALGVGSWACWVGETSWREQCQTWKRTSNYA